MDDGTSKIIERFASLAEKKNPDPALALTTPVEALRAALERTTALFKGVLRPTPGGIDPNAVGRNRFPDLAGVATEFARGLTKHPEIAQGNASPEAITATVKLDQATGRLVFCGNRFADGGTTGSVLTGAAAQHIGIDACDQATARIGDPNTPGATRGAITAAFEEALATLARWHAQQQGQQQQGVRTVTPYQQQIDQAGKDHLLTQAVESYLTHVKNGGTAS